jgi:hypothetical protein
MANMNPDQKPVIKNVNGQYCTVYSGRAYPISKELAENLRLLHGFFREETDAETQVIADKIEQYLGEDL